MLYNTGTIAINGNTATGSGTNWTAPASQVRAGQTIIVMSNPVQLFQISSVNSATSMTVTPAASPALSGQKYGILVSDNISVDGLAQAMSQLINEYDENIGAWETFATTSANQSITVTINGTPVTIPGIGKLAQKGTNGALPIDQGGTGATTPEGGRRTLGLGSAATANATIDKLMPGVNSENLFSAKSIGMAVARHIDDFSDTTLIGFGRYTGSTINKPQGNGVGLQLQFDNTPSTTWFVWTTDGRAFIQTSHAQNGTYNWHEVYTTANTTKSSDGTLKSASPVARIVKSQEENQRMDVDKNGFAWCGCGTANEEAEGISISRQETGVYVITGSSGLASQGWQLIPPMDPSGMGELGVVEAEQTESGGLTIRLFKQKYILSGEGEIIKTKGEPMDVPANSWIDVRLDMPESSAWNQRQKEAAEPAS
ncbi:phage tail protein [Escherichia coli]|uniref:phage tail fiber protein n=1 Tax=Escherichia coli TaxID=562 RepID=UPI002258AA9D|nr:phage tail protein [Escherichia coli]MCX3201129.1 phage tail protein [Escherichia coli]